MEKLIPYSGKQMLLKGLILLHRGKVTVLSKVFSRNLVAKSRSHDNSLAGEFELKYTAWMANQEIDLSSDEKAIALKHHFEENDHHLEHFKSLGDMDLTQLLMYLFDLMSRVSFTCTNSNDIKEYMDKVYDTIHEEIKDETIASILCNTAKTLAKYEPLEIKGMFPYEPKKENS